MLILKHRGWSLAVVGLYIACAYVFMRYDPGLPFFFAFFSGLAIALISIGLNRGAYEESQRRSQDAAS